MPTGARSTFIAISIATLCACSGPAPAPQDKAASGAEARAHGRDTDATVFDDMLRTEDKARAVEDVVRQQKADADAAIEQQTDGERAGNPDE